jgi:flavin-dependent dehydrogenase
MAGRIKNNPNFNKLFEQFLETLPIQSQGKASVRAHPIPYGPGHIRVGKNSTILIGDAAGYIEPVTGEGIYYSIKSAVLAAKAIIQSENAESAFRNYRNSCNKTILRHIKRGYLARPFLYSKIMHPYAIEKIKGNTSWSNGFMEILSGKTDYINYFRKAIFPDR